MVKVFRNCGSGKKRRILKVIWAILCDKAIINQQSNNVSLIEILDEITLVAPAPEPVTETSEEPNIFIDASLVASWARSDFNMPEKAQTRTRIVTSGGEGLLSNELEIDLTDDMRIRTIGLIGRIPFLTQDGEYTIKIEAKAPDSDWLEMFELPLWVNTQTDTPS